MVVAMRFLAIALTAVLIVVSIVAIVGGFALLARRLLGMRFGLVRLLVAGLLGFAVAGPIARAVRGAVPATGDRVLAPVWFLVLTSAAALIVAMMFLVIAEALVPSGSLLGTGGGPRVTATVGLYQLLGYNLLVVCAILALRVLVLIFRPDR
jgi:hypothetical protein